MIPFIPAIILGKLFYDLAAKFGKNAWLFAGLGAIVCIAGEFIFGFVYLLIVWNTQEQYNALALSILSITIGVVSDYFLYMYLKRKWEKK
jgi:hypothetical protein